MTTPEARLLAAPLADHARLAPIVFIPNQLDVTRLVAIAALVAELDPERAAACRPAELVRFGLDLAADQATDFRARLAQLRENSAMT